MIKVGILAHEFLINTGANDFLKNLIRGLASDSEIEILFLCPLSDQKIEHATPANLKEKFRKYPRIKNAARAIARKMRPLTDVVMKDEPDEYTHYLEACPNMQILPCSTDPESLRRIRDETGVDIFFPSIHILPPDIRYVTYWPDCQPKHLPEFFDDEAQRVRDERILGLLASGNPMIINSRDAKQDMVKFYNASEHQVYDLPFAPIIEVDRLIPRPELLEKYSIRKPYFIICNQFWIHKSAETVIQAAALCQKRGIDVDFIFTGKMEEPRKPAYIEYIKEQTTSLGVQNIVKFLGYVPKADQLELIKHSIAVVQPTLFEGGPGGGAVYDSHSLGVRAIVSDLPINYELPLDSGRITLFKKQCPEDLVEKLYHHVVTAYAQPPVEDLYQQSVRSTKLLSLRIKESILAALA